MDRVDRVDRVERLDVATYTVPLPAPESDGTLEWDATTVLVVEASAGGTSGLGYSYTSAGAAAVVHDLLTDVVVGTDVLATGRAWSAMVRAVRNIGRPGVASSAIAAVDVALWDLRCRVLGISVADGLGPHRDAVPAYGSGGFTSLTDAELADQLGGWAADGLAAVKMKVGREPDRDPERVAVARRAVGDGVALFVDANGAYSRQEALHLARRFADEGVTWFEEPVSSDDLDGLRLVRDGAPPGMEVTAGEYGYDLPYFRRMLDAGAVDCLQADVTRAAGITGFVQVGALTAARSLDLSAHTAPQVSAHACSGVPRARHLEWFADHVRVEALLFDGALAPCEGALRPDPARPGLGLELKRTDAEKYRR
jgi:L-alanine-DL-glutamate epimerase-like enolase superfamily enzyme